MSTFLMAVARRLTTMIVALFGATIIIFLILHLTGDPTTALLPDTATPAQIAVFRHANGFDRPILVQYVEFLSHMVRGDFGQSLRYQAPALQVVLDRMPATAELMGISVVLTLLVSMPLAIFVAVRDNAAARALLRLTTVLGQGVPGFVLAILMIFVFSVQLHWLPSSGNRQFPTDLIMPSIVLASFTIPQVTRVLWTSLSEVLRSDYVRTARAKGLPPHVVYGKHALRNALIPFLTLLGVQVGVLLGGSVVTETIFGWPGIGQLMVQAISNRDYPVVQAGVAVVVVAFLVVNALVDITYPWLDPRLRRAS
jgi:ABC-type dipeptide/oligopeptide/nickel transport system permease component